MELDSVLVTGANRGIGLEFVRQLVQLPKPPKYVFGTYRSRDGLKPLEDIASKSTASKVVLIKMDITKGEEVEAAKRTIEDTVKDLGLTLLINNAGVLKMEAFPDLTEENLLFHFNTNTVGPVKILQEMLPLLQKAAARKVSGLCVSRAAVLNISSRGGTIGDRVEEQASEWYGLIGYRTSKASLNMAMRVVALEVKDQGILVVQMCPGWVKTDIISNGEIEASESISSMLKTLPQLNESHQGAFLDRHGETIPF